MAGVLGIAEAGRNSPQKGGPKEERATDKIGACAKTQANRCASFPAEYRKCFAAGRTAADNAAEGKEGDGRRR